MVSVLHRGVIFQIYNMIEKSRLWGMITNGLKSPDNIYLEAKNQNMSTYGGFICIIAFSYNIKHYFVFWLILRGDNAVLILSLWRLTYVILPPKCIKFPQHSKVKILLQNDLYVTTSLWNTSNLGESALYCTNNNIENIWRLYFHNRSIHGGQNQGYEYLYFIFWFLKLISYGNSFWQWMEIHFNLISMKISHFQLSFIKLWSNLEADGGS